MRAIYGGVRDPGTGAQLLPGFPPGSELQLAALISAPQPFPVATSYMKYLVFGGIPNSSFRDFDYGRDTPRARQYGEAVLDVPPDGMNAFFARGGKLLLSHGWDDGLIPANNTLRFYRRLYSALPQARAQQQLRLFMVPGMQHCSGGEGPYVFDTLRAIDDWARTGNAPSRIVASRPPAKDTPPLSRPLCPYPLFAQYEGKGDQAEAQNFHCAGPRE